MEVRLAVVEERIANIEKSQERIAKSLEMLTEAQTQHIRMHHRMDLMEKDINDMQKELYTFINNHEKTLEGAKFTNNLLTWGVGIITAIIIGISTAVAVNLGTQK